MSAMIVEKLKQYSGLRTTLLDWIFKYVPRPGFEHNIVFHTLLVLSTVIVIITIFATTRKLTLFSLHPVFMTIGTVIFLAEGIVSYRNSALLDFLSPIMQHNKKIKVRAIHQSLQTTGGVFLALGMLLIASHKMELGKTLIPMTPHSILGTVAMALIIVQIVSGQEKLANLESGNKRVLRWHGDLGLLTWDALSVTIMLGLLSFVPLSFATLLVLIVVCAVWLSVHAQMLGRTALHKYDSAYDMDGSSEGLNGLVASVSAGGGSSGGSAGAGGLNREDSFGILDVEGGDGRLAEASGLIQDSGVEEGSGGGSGAFDKAFVRA